MTSFFMCVAADRTLRTADLTLLLIPVVYIIDYRIAYCDVTVSLNFRAMNLKVVKRAILISPTLQYRPRHRWHLTVS